MLSPITPPRPIYLMMADIIMHQDFIIFVILLLITIIAIGFIIRFCVKKVKNRSKVVLLPQQKNVLNEAENGTYSDQTPTMIFHVITPDNENGIGGSSENVSQAEYFNSQDLFAGRAQFAGRGFHK